jgi:UDP-N-acetyl-D-mannosaminuronic acid dehydrogenase
VRQTFNTLSVIGLGYIGFPTAVVFASHGVNVIGVDVNQRAVDSVNRGEAHIAEPGLNQLTQAAVLNRWLRATTKPEPADGFIIAVPTPFRQNHEPDLSFVEQAAISIAPVLEKGNIVILESTSPVGTTEQLGSILLDKRPDLTFPNTAGEQADVQIAYCPERVLPGQTLFELVHNDRVIGGLTPFCARRAASIYEIFLKGRCFETDARTAEMTKLAENAFRDVNIAFANELSLVCEELNIDVWKLIELANLHPRVNILHPGPGVGGHCIAVDPWFIIHSAPQLTALMTAARRINDAKPFYVVDKIKAALRQGSGARIACLGLSFKADIDDLRESPAVNIVERLAQETHAELLVVEPYVHQIPGRLSQFERVRLVSLEEALQHAEIVVVLVNHKEFYEINPAQLAEKTVIDTRGVFKGETGFGSWRQRARAASAGAVR